MTEEQAAKIEIAASLKCIHAHVIVTNLLLRDIVDKLKLLIAISGIMFGAWLARSFM